MNQGHPKTINPKGSQSSRAAVGAAAAQSGSGSLPASPDRIRTSARVVGPLAKIQSRKAIVFLTSLSLGATYFIFPDINWWWLAYVCMVPWLIAVCTGKKARFVYFASWIFGLGYFLINIHWMIPVTLPGYIALCFYFSFAFPLAAWPIRHMYQRHAIPVAISAPIAWVAMEYVRTLRPLSFPWLLLGHTQYEQITLIQISDLIGVYGVSFLLVMVNGWITDLLIGPIMVWRSEQGTRLHVGTLATFVAFAATLIYGAAQSSPDHFKPGPRIAVIQHDFPMFVDERARRTPTYSIVEGHLELARQAAREKPDLILLPETVMAGWFNDEFLQAPPTALDEMLRRRHPGWQLSDLKRFQEFGRNAKRSFQALSNESGCAILLGGAAMEWKPTAIPPRVEAYNSAFLLLPDPAGSTTQPAAPVARYDKNHLVIFGEYVPFRHTHHWLYEWLNSITPWGKGGRDYSLTPGERFNVMEFPARDDPKVRYRAGTPICYEEIMPYIGREFARPVEREKNVDMLLAISNDGWFLHTSELEQHLAGAVFRTVENRIALARSVNTGASANVHPNGRVDSRVQMSAEKIARLEGVEKVLRDLMSMLDQITPDSAESFSRQRLAITTMLNKELAEALQKVGPEIMVIQDRLINMNRDMIVARDPTQRRAAIAELRDQLREDLRTIDRWRNRPHTAPAYAVQQLMLDSRTTLYSRWGDFFAKAAVIVYLVMIVDWLVRRIRLRREDRPPETPRKVA